MNSLLLALSMTAASVPSQPPAPPQPLSPLLYVKVMGPAGMKVTFHPGTPGERTLDTPAIVGLAPVMFTASLSASRKPPARNSIRRSKSAAPCERLSARRCGTRCRWSSWKMKSAASIDSAQ